MNNLPRTLSCLFPCAGLSVSQAGELKWDAPRAHGNPDGEEDAR